MRSSAVNPGGAGLSLVVWEQLSSHNLTLTAKAPNGSWAAAPFASLRNSFGFTEWSNPANATRAGAGAAVQPHRSPPGHYH